MSLEPPINPDDQNQNTELPASQGPTQVKEGSDTSMIFVLRNQKVLMDRDVAAIYGIDLHGLKQVVRKNQERFPEDFMFVCSGVELAGLRENGVLPASTKYAPMMFTEQGVAMLSSVIQTVSAANANTEIIRTFVQLQELAENHAQITQRLGGLEARYESHFALIFGAIEKLTLTNINEVPTLGVPIGFDLHVRPKENSTKTSGVSDT